MKSDWTFAPGLTFLNHGSFGAAPRVVLEAQRKLQDQLEADPIRFLAPERELEPKLDRVRWRIANLVNADAKDLAFVRNATDGVNAVVRSLPFGPGDELLYTSFGYGACNKALRFAAEQSGATARRIDFSLPIDSANVLQVIADAIRPESRFLLIDHVTSETALIMPLPEILKMARDAGLRVMVDGAHAPGMIDLDIKKLDPDYYTANHHKWLCGPKASGFLVVRPEFAREVNPTVISHGAQSHRADRHALHCAFDWPGTYDPTPILAMEASLDFLEGLLPGGLPALRTANRQLALAARQMLHDRLGATLIAPEAMVGSMAAVLLPDTYTVDRIEERLRAGFEIESRVAGRLVRISAHAYNDMGDYVALVDALEQLAQ